MKRTNVLKISILFILFMLYFLVTFRNAVSARYYLVLRRLKKWVLVTFIRKNAKVRIYARTKNANFTNFGHIHELFHYELRR